MKVKVVPKRPIPGILPKNKWIDVAMELDLNELEIRRCLQFGFVYDEEGKVIDLEYLKTHKTKESVKLKFVADEPEKVEIPVKVEVKTSIPRGIAVGAPIASAPKQEKPEVKEEVVVKEEIKEEVQPEVIKEYKLNVLSCEQKDEYVELEIQFNSSVEKVEGNMYGIFTVLAGTRPNPLEYKSGENWVKFNNKFGNFNTLTNEDTFVFRFNPKTGFKYRVSLKENNEVLAKLDGEYK